MSDHRHALTQAEREFNAIFEERLPPALKILKAQALAFAFVEQRWKGKRGRPRIVERMTKLADLATQRGWMIYLGGDHYSIEPMTKFVPVYPLSRSTTTKAQWKEYKLGARWTIQARTRDDLRALRTTDHLTAMGIINNYHNYVKKLWGSAEAAPVYGHVVQEQTTWPYAKTYKYPKVWNNPAFHITYDTRPPTIHVLPANNVKPFTLLLPRGATSQVKPVVALHPPIYSVPAQPVYGFPAWQMFDHRNQPAGFWCKPLPEGAALKKTTWERLRAEFEAEWPLLVARILAAPYLIPDEVPF